MWTLVGIGSGAVCMLVGVIFGVALCEYKKEHDGFLILAKMLEKMAKQSKTGLECEAKCLTCGFRAWGASSDDVIAELEFHQSQQHPEEKKNVAGHPVSA